MPRGPRTSQSNPSVDKIALIVKLQTDHKDAKNEIYVMRVGTDIDNGIILQTWDDFRIYKSAYLENCWFRHLYCERNDKFLSNSMKFVQRMRDKPYAQGKVIKSESGQTKSQ